MAHHFEIGMFVQEPAWHRLGTVVQTAPTVEEAIRLAGLDWHVNVVPLYVQDVSSAIEEYHEIDEWRATQRSTDGKILGVVGTRYTPLQNVDAFAFFNPLLHEGDCSLESAGSLKGGTRIWVLAKINGISADVVHDDRLDAYVLLVNGHDGTFAVLITYTAVRVVCWNTMSLAISKADADKRAIRLLHTRNLPEALKIVQTAMDVNRRTFDFTVEAYRAMAKHAVDHAGLKQYVREVFRADDKDKMPRAWEMIEALHDNGMGADMPGVRGTLWGAYNAVSEWTEHIRGKDALRLEKNWFGGGREIRDRALSVALSRLN